MIPLLACAATLPDAEFPEVVPVSTAATWGPEDLAAEWSTATAGGMPEVTRPRDVWLWFFAQGDASCPGAASTIADGNITGCTASTGYSYSGFGGYSDVDDTDRVGWVLKADARVSTPSGESFWVGGHVGHLDGDSESIEEIEGTWLWEADDAWLAEWTSGLWRLTFTDTLRIDGALTFRGLSIAAEAVEVDDAGCVGGSLSIRDPGGGWHQLGLDAETCDGCAQATFEGEPTGEVCLDLAPLAAQWSR